MPYVLAPDQGTASSRAIVWQDRRTSGICDRLVADNGGVRLEPAFAELGDAYPAGLAVGFWCSVEAIAAQWQADRTVTPNMDKARAAAMRAEWHRAPERAKGWEQA